MACVRRSVARANTCRLALLLAQRSLEQMVNLLEEYESAKSVPGSLESFDLKGDREGSNPPSSSGESRANQTSGAHFSTPPIMSSASACVWLGAVISQRATVWRSRPGAEPAGRAREDPRLVLLDQPSADHCANGGSAADAPHKCTFFAVQSNRSVRDHMGIGVLAISAGLSLSALGALLLLKARPTPAPVAA